MKPSFRRKEKYRKKIEGSISQLRLLRYGKEQKTKFTSSVQDQVKIEQVVKSLISGSAPSMLVHFYCDFAKKAVQLIHRHKGANLINELNILDQIWSTRGLNTSLLTAIKNFFYPGYIPPVPCEDWETQEECEDHGCFWYDDSCHSTPPVYPCDHWLTQGECEAHGCYWYDGSCHAEPPGACAWLYKMKLTFSGNVSATNLDDFPILVHLTNANFNFAHAKVNGEDIRFMDSDLCPSDGTPLKHEIEHWDQAGQEAWVWVKVPRIDGGSVVDFIYLYYGNNAAADGQDSTNVWDSNYVMVQHMYDKPDTSHVSDSTINANNGAKKGANEPIESVGKMWKGQDFDNTDDYINCGSDATLQIGGEGKSFTLETWTKRGSSGAHDWALSQGTTSNSKGLQFGYNDNDHFMIGFFANDYQCPNATSDVGEWHHWVAAYNGSTNSRRVYRDGNDVGGDVAPNDYSGSGDMIIGRNNWATYRYFDGIIDECRISNIVRSADWIKATYLTMTDALITYGAEESA